VRPLTGQFSKYSWQVRFVGFSFIAPCIPWTWSHSFCSLCPTYPTPRLTTTFRSSTITTTPANSAVSMFTMRALFALSMSLLLALPASAQSVTSAAASSSISKSSASTSTTTSSGASSSSSDGPTIHRVNVGIGGYSYDPNVTYAAEGDIVQFVFYPTNHSVIRAEYTGSDACGGNGCNPCVPYDTIHGSGGFHSNNQLTQTTPKINSIDGSTKVWNYTVTNASEPVFYYCNAIGSCHPVSFILSSSEI
jgi:plastocyanin